jgi:hypothetical protein
MQRLSERKKEKTNHNSGGDSSGGLMPDHNNDI